MDRELLRIGKYLYPRNDEAELFAKEMGAVMRDYLHGFRFAAADQTAEAAEGRPAAAIRSVYNSQTVMAFFDFLTTHGGWALEQVLAAKARDGSFSFRAFKHIFEEALDLATTQVSLLLRFSFFMSLWPLTYIPL